MNAIEALHIDPRIIFEISAGVDTIDAIAENYGLDAAFLEQVINTPHMRRAIKDKRKELDDTGYTLAAKAKLCFESLLEDTFRKAKGADVSLPQVLDAARFFRTVAGLDKMEGQFDTEKFSIVFNINQSANPTKFTMNKDVIDVMPTISIDFDNEPSLSGEVPVFLQPTSADVNSILHYA